MAEHRERLLSSRKCRRKLHRGEFVRRPIGRRICGVKRRGEFARFASRRICLTPSGGEFKIYGLRANSPLNGSFSKFSSDGLREFSAAEGCKFSGGRPSRQPSKSAPRDAPNCRNWGQIRDDSDAGFKVLAVVYTKRNWDLERVMTTQCEAALAKVYMNTPKRRAASIAKLAPL